MKKNQKIQFLLTCEQWLGVALLVILVLATLIAIKHFQPQQEQDTIWINDSTMKDFADYQAQQDSLRKAQWKQKYPRDTIAIHMQPFDPNTADSATLVHLGFKPWQAKNMLKYRAKGGRYRNAEDLKRLYGMTDSMFQALTPYICIPHAEMDTADVDSARVDSLPKWPVKKDTVLNLRTADTTELKMIRGIGSYRARQIVRYREQLGGFARVEQVMEANGMQQLDYDSVKQYFSLDSVVVKQMNVNTIGVKRLSTHPYLRFEQAKAIYELRRRKIHLDSIQQLQELDCLSHETLEKIAPYLNFDRK